jgi:GNAT superfamily N-acetyltransferase
VTHEPPSYEIELTDTPHPDARDEIARSLLAYNEALLGPPAIRTLAVLVRSPDGAKVMGGLWGRTSFQWLFIELLFLPEALRHRHLGTELVRSAEAEAQKRGCLGSWLDTFSLSARHFYERQGYELFGEIGDYPPGNRRCFMLKRFDERAGFPRSP